VKTAAAFSLIQCTSATEWQDR